MVYLAWSKEAQRKLFAIKTFKTAREGDGISPTAIREIMLLRELNHEHIVRLDSVHINRSEPSLSLAFDYAEHDLYEMIRHHRDKLHGPIDAYVLKSVMWQLLNGLSYLHQHWIIHRDLKPSNVLVMGEGEQHGQVKIADFGLARIFQSPLRPLSENGVVVTIWYRAPELLLGARHYTRAVDVWAAACIFAELLMLKPLFQGQEKKQGGNPFQGDQLERVFRLLGTPSPSTWPELEHLPHWHDNTDNVRQRRPDYPSQHGPALQQHLLTACRELAASRGMLCALQPNSQLVALLLRMLDYNPATRITADEALRHPYFMEEPRPGANAFMQGRRVVASYPPRIRYNNTPPPENGTTAAGGVTAPQHQRGSSAANLGAMPPSAQQASAMGGGGPQMAQRASITTGSGRIGNSGFRKRKAEHGFR